ncbi:MAG: SRPBCC family protein [Limisphaerales bacterium]
MDRFRKESQIGAPAEVVFRWHEAPDAFEKLIPPWENVRIIERSAPGIKNGTKISLEMRLGPFKRRWVALHTHYEPGRMFRDEQVSGPFSAWVHTHVIEPRGLHLSLLIDDISYKLPLGLIGQIFGGWLVRRKLKRLFDYRHRVTRQACERHVNRF